MKLVISWENFSDVTLEANQEIESILDSGVEWDIWDETYGKLGWTCNTDGMIRDALMRNV